MAGEDIQLKPQLRDEYGNASSAQVDPATGRSTFEAFITFPDGTEEALEPLVKGFCQAREVGLGKVAQPIRVSMTGQKTGPGLYEMLVAAGKPMALRRIRAGADRCPTPEA